MITETDKAIYDRLSTVLINNNAIPVRFMGQEEQFAVNVDWDTASPYFVLQNYDINFAMERWSQGGKVIEYNYPARKAIINAPDFPMYLWYQVDCFARNCGCWFL